MLATLWLPILFAVAEASVADNGKIAYKSPSAHFQTTKTKSELIFSDHLGSRQLKIRACNKTAVNAFWSSLEKVAEARQSATPLKAGEEKDKTWLLFGGKKFLIFSFEPAYSFLKKVPLQSLVLFSESRRQCKEK